ncbi:hypothetical protein [Engelhardtia mirabilis]|uniref:Uncharacterized protein n=1 Tax=Engelhardtia mirabilis TaxID=2528011 RepID=A0A518BQW1_9BACT|nr:hypothetical protein Pla133_44490 [Planctomycetes bacterium Pla133]QDV03656.1 hypothetical protein Pla86_44470 [Planctomycetes bacterium Pla86]
MGELIGSGFWLGSLVVVVIALTNAARTRQWGWFVASLLIWPVAIAYLLVAYKSPKTIRALENRRRQAQTRERAEIAELKKKVAALEGERA